MSKVLVVPTDRMPEAEVSLRLAFYLVDARITTAVVSVAIDGAQIKTGTRVHFMTREFMRANGWRNADDSDAWQADYVSKHGSHIRVDSTPGQGDVVAHVASGRILRVECKKGTPYQKQELTGIQGHP